VAWQTRFITPELYMTQPNGKGVPTTANNRFTTKWLATFSQ
jgi:hypothetical protein